MATIFYSSAGEGRGHATRVRAVVEELRKQRSMLVSVDGMKDKLNTVRGHYMHGSSL